MWLCCCSPDPCAALPIPASPTLRLTDVPDSSSGWSIQDNDPYETWEQSSTTTRWTSVPIGSADYLGAGALYKDGLALSGCSYFIIEASMYSITSNTNVEQHGLWIAEESERGDFDTSGVRVRMSRVNENATTGSLYTQGCDYRCLKTATYAGGVPIAYDVPDDDGIVLRMEIESKSTTPSNLYEVRTYLGGVLQTTTTLAANLTNHPSASGYFDMSTSHRYGVFCDHEAARIGEVKVWWGLK